MNDGLVICGLALLGVVLLAAVGYASVIEAERWSAFKAEHDCKAVAHIRGHTFNTIGFDAKGGVVVGIGSTPNKTGWLCNDGVTYFR